MVQLMFEFEYCHVWRKLQRKATGAATKHQNILLRKC